MDQTCPTLRELIESEVKETKKIAQEAHAQTGLLQQAVSNNDIFIKNLANDIKKFDDKFVTKEYMELLVQSMNEKISFANRVIVGVSGVLLTSFLSVVTYFLFQR